MSSIRGALAVLARNVDSVLTYVTPDVVLLEPGIDVKGRDAYRALADLWKVYTVTSFAMTPESHAFAHPRGAAAQAVTLRYYRGGSAPTGHSSARGA